MNRYFLAFEVNQIKCYQTTFIAENTEFLYRIAIEHCKRIIEKYATSIDAENATIEIKQFSFLGEISETESKKAPFEQIEPQKQKQIKQNENSFMCECGAKFPTVQARSGHKKGCKL